MSNLIRKNNHFTKRSGTGLRYGMDNIVVWAVMFTAPCPMSTSSCLGCSICDLAPSNTRYAPPA